MTTTNGPANTALTVGQLAIHANADRAAGAANNKPDNGYAVPLT